MCAAKANRIRYPLAAFLWALCFGGCLARAQAIAFETRAYSDSPSVFVTESSSAFRDATGRRQFVTVKNISSRAIAALLFQQVLPRGSQAEIVAMERTSIVIRPGEQRRVSLSITETANRLQSARDSDEPPGKPEISVVAVEFVDSTQWNAP